MVRTMEREFWLKSTGKLIKFEPHQKRILNEMFRTDSKGKLVYGTMVYSCPKKSGKTEVAAAVTYAFARTYGGEMYSIANDEEREGPCTIRRRHAGGQTTTRKDRHRRSNRVR